MTYDEPIHHQCFFFSFLFFSLSFTAIKIELSNCKAGAKMGDPREKPPDHPQAELGSHVTRARLNPTAVLALVVILYEIYETFKMI